MAFDWPRFLDQYRIDYVSRGPSTAKGNVYTHCPFCGDSDHSHHMGISLQGKGWGCWKYDTHRGIAPLRLVKALLNCSWQEAARITHSERRAAPKDTYMERVRGLISAPLGDMPRGVSLSLPQGFIPLELHSHYAGYLRDRGFSLKQVDELAGRFYLGISRDREWQWRIIIPVYDQDGNLSTWTARAIGRSLVRYKTLESETAITDCLLNEAEIQEGGNTLVVNEGPFDCMNLSLYADEFNAKATCLFGKNISRAQRNRLAQLRPLYKHIVLLLDPDAKFGVLRQASLLRALNVSTFALQGEKDPGELNASEARNLLAQISDGVARLSQ